MSQGFAVAVARARAESTVFNLWLKATKSLVVGISQTHCLDDLSLWGRPEKTKDPVDELVLVA